jgi:hypothetical protein
VRQHKLKRILEVFLLHAVEGGVIPETSVSFSRYIRINVDIFPFLRCT